MRACLCISCSCPAPDDAIAVPRGKREEHSGSNRQPPSRRAKLTSRMTEISLSNSFLDP